MKIEQFSIQTQTGLRQFCKDVHRDELLLDDFGGSQEAWAWFLIQLKIAPDRPEWFPKGKSAICQILEGKLMDEARELLKGAGIPL